MTKTESLNKWGVTETAHTWMDGRSDLKSELQLATDMICRKPAAQSIAYNPVPVRKQVLSWKLSPNPVLIVHRENGYILQKH